MSGTDESKKQVPELEDNSDQESRNLAQKEALGFGKNQDLEKIADANQHDRRENIRDHIAIGVVVAFWAWFVIAMIGGLIWVFHLLTPEKCHFLTMQQVNHIQNIFMGTLVGGAFGYLSKSKYL